MTLEILIMELIALGGSCVQAYGMIDVIDSLKKQEYDSGDIGVVLTTVISSAIILGYTLYCQLLALIGQADYWQLLVSIFGGISVWIILFWGIPNTIKEKERKKQEEAQKKADEERMKKEIEDNNRFFGNYISRKDVLKSYTWEDEEAKHAICAEKQHFALVHALSNNNFKARIYIIPHADLLECQIIEDNSTVVDSAIGRAIVGGLIAGRTGAIVGAVTQGTSDVINRLEVRIVTNNLSNARTSIVLIDRRVDRDSTFYKERYALAQDIYAMVFATIRAREATNENRNLRENIMLQKSDDVTELQKRLERIEHLKVIGMISDKEYDEARTRILSGL